MKAEKSRETISSFYENVFNLMDIAGRNIETLNLIKSELVELERLAKIGEATEKAFEDGKYITDASSKTLSNVDDLIEWAVEND